MEDETWGIGDGGGLYEWEGALDLTALSEEELTEHLKGLAREERELSYRRRILQGRIDLIRAELVQRGGVTLSPEELARILLGRGEEPSGPADPGGAPC